MDDLKRAARKRAEADRALRPTKRSTGVVTSIVDATHVVVNVGTRSVKATVPASIPGISIDAEVILRVANESVIEAVLKTADGKVSGTAGSWSWWYKDHGILVEVHFEYSAALASSGALSLGAATTGIPSTLWPSDETPLAAWGYGTYPVTARFGPTGTLTLRNNHSASVASLGVHGIWSKA